MDNTQVVMFCKSIQAKTADVQIVDKTKGNIVNISLKEVAKLISSGRITNLGFDTAGRIVYTGDSSEVLNNGNIYKKIDLYKAALRECLNERPGIKCQYIGSNKKCITNVDRFKHEFMFYKNSKLEVKIELRVMQDNVLYALITRYGSDGCMVWMYTEKVNIDNLDTDLIRITNKQDYLWK